MKEQNKIALCAIGRRENLYAREFVSYYLALGFDHIFLYDNNREWEERLAYVLSDFIDSGLVSVIPWPMDSPDNQKAAYNNCYHTYGKHYTWMAFFDFDEFLTIVNGDDIHAFMSHYDAFHCVLVNWMDYTDGNLLEYDGRPMVERFTVPMPFDKRVGGDFPENNHVKSIVRCGFGNLQFVKNPHIPSVPRLYCCDSLGRVCKQKPRIPYDHSVAYIRHFTTKTIGEWLENKWSKGTAGLTHEQFQHDYADFFFRVNERTPEKEAFIERWNNRKGHVAAIALGRMGNQMFIAAAAMTFARRTGREFVGLVYNITEKFDFDYPLGQFSTVMRNVNYISPEKVAGFYHMRQGEYVSNGFPSVSERDVVLCDYFQDNSCIDRDIALSLFKPYPEILKEIADVYGDLSDVVCVNVRRGDYLQVRKRGFRVLTREQIVDMLDEHFPATCRVMFVSDDIPWCRENFTGERFIFADRPCRYKPEMDLYLQTQCGAGNIIANSSFSWWGAYLGEQGTKVVTPWPWFDSPKKPKMTNLLPEGWIKQGREWMLWVTYHKDELLQQYNLHEDEHHHLFAVHHNPTHVPSVAILSQLDLLSMNELNPCYSEFVTLWFVWKNRIRTDYVGFCHYRRMLNVSRLPERGECQVLKMNRFRGGETIRSQYARCHNVDDIDLMIQIIDMRYGVGNPYSSYLLTSRTLLTNVCFLMTWKDFILMGDFIFRLLDDFADATGCGYDVQKWHDKAVRDFDEESASYQQRLPGFLGERLVSAWISINMKWYI